jgi:hypothetical protein
MANKASLMPYADHTTAEYERCLLGAYIMGADIGERVNKGVFMSEAHNEQNRRPDGIGKNPDGIGKSGGR